MWMKLLRIWAGLRADHVQGIMPKLMRMTATGLVVQLDRTKTSGPGRKIRWMTVYVSLGAYLTDPTWLKTGFDLWQSEPFCFERDYLVMLPGENLETVHKVKAKYFDMVRFTRAVIGALKLP
eukprot:4751014-Karenia_brevis.AAC.1